MAVIRKLDRQIDPKVLAALLSQQVQQGKQSYADYQTAAMQGNPNTVGGGLANLGTGIQNALGISGNTNIRLAELMAERVKNEQRARNNKKIGLAYSEFSKDQGKGSERTVIPEKTIVTPNVDAPPAGGPQEAGPYYPPSRPESGGFIPEGPGRRTPPYNTPYLGQGPSAEDAFLAEAGGFETVGPPSLDGGSQDFALGPAQTERVIPPVTEQVPPRSAQLARALLESGDPSQMQAGLQIIQGIQAANQPPEIAGIADMGNRLQPYGIGGNPIGPGFPKSATPDARVGAQTTERGQDNQFIIAALNRENQRILQNDRLTQEEKLARIEQNFKMAENDLNRANRIRVAEISKGPLVSIENKSETAFEQESNKKLGDLAATFFDEARKRAEKAGPGIDRAQRLLQGPGIETAGPGQIAGRLKDRFFAMFGDKEAAERITSREEFEQYSMEGLLNQLREQKGPQTEGDAERAQRTLATLSKTEDGNRFILMMDIAIKRKDQAMHRFLREYRKKNKTLNGAEDAWIESKENAQRIFDDRIWETPAGKRILGRADARQRQLERNFDQ